MFGPDGWATAAPWIFEHAAAGLGIVDAHGRFLDVNAELCRLAGRSRPELLGMAPDDLFVEYVGPNAMEQLRMALAGQATTLGGRARVARPDGSTVWILASAALLRIPGVPSPFFFVQVQDITDLQEAQVALQSTAARLEHALEDVVAALSRAAESRDSYTAGHQLAVSQLATAIAVEMGLDAPVVSNVRMGSLLHDIGKLAVPIEILTRARRLTPAEHGVVETHPDAGAQFLDGVYLGEPIADIIRQHHERIDGSGYPAGLDGGQIRLESKIVAVADVVDAMCAHRPYRPAGSLDDAIELLRAGRGRSFDASVVDAAMDCARDVLGSRGRV